MGENKALLIGARGTLKKGGGMKRKVLCLGLVIAKINWNKNLPYLCSLIKNNNIKNIWKIYISLG